MSEKNWKKLENKALLGQVGDQVGQVRDQVGQGQGQELDKNWKQFKISFS